MERSTCKLPYGVGIGACVVMALLYVIVTVVVSAGRSDGLVVIAMILVTPFILGAAALGGAVFVYGWNHLLCAD